MLGLTAILGSSIGQYPQHGQLVLLVKRQNTFIEKVCSGNWRLAGIELGMCHLAVGINVGLLINPPNTFECAHVEGILRPQITRVFSSQSHRALVSLPACAQWLVTATL